MEIQLVSNFIYQCSLIPKCSFEAQFTGEGGVADWHPIDLESKVVRRRDGECTERLRGHIEAEKTSVRNVDESLRKYMDTRWSLSAFSVLRLRELS